MFEYRHVLYATDIDDSMSHLMKKVIKAVNKTGTRLTVLHCVKSITAAYGGAAMYIPQQSFNDLELNMIEQAKQKLIEITDEVQIQSGKVIVESSHHVKKTILEKAEELEVDAIFINGHKHNLIGRLGAVADEIINESKQDVIVLK